MSMTCDEFRQLMADHLGDELVVEVKQQFEFHRSSCETCGFDLESYTYTVKLSRKLPRCGPLPREVEQRLWERVKEHLGEKK